MEIISITDSDPVVARTSSRDCISTSSSSSVSSSSSSSSDSTPFAILRDSAVSMSPFISKEGKKKTRGKKPKINLMPYFGRA